MSSASPSPPPPPDGLVPDETGLRLRVLGRPALVGPDEDGQVRELLGVGKPLALLVRIAMAGPRGVPRETLADLLWSHTEAERGRQSVRQAMLQVRRAARAELFTTTPTGAVALAAPIPSDLDALLDGLRDGDRDGALAQVGGAFLDDFRAPGAGGFERWMEGERARIAAIVTGARESAAREALELGQFREAMRLAAVAREDAPDPEPAWCIEIEAALAGGDPVSAGLAAEALAGWLQELEREPSATTRRLLARARASLRDQRATPIDIPVIAPAVAAAASARALRARVIDTIGRESEFATLWQAWQHARARCVPVVLEGPAGIGKSRLVHDLHGRLRASGATSIHVIANRGARELPYALLAELVTALAAAPGALGVSPETATTLVTFLPALRETYRGVRDADMAAAARDVGDVPLRRALALAELVAAVSEERPVALLLDDMQWCDPASAVVLHTAHVRCTQAHALLLTSRRTESAPAVGGAHDAADDALRIVLGPLPESGVRSLLESMATLPQATWTDWFPEALHRATDGVPQAMLDTLVTLADQGVLRCEDGAWRCESPVLLASRLSLPGMDEARRQALEPAERCVLAALAIAGLPLDEAPLLAAARSIAASPEPIPTLSPLPGQQVLVTRATLEQLLERGLVTADEPDGAPATWRPVDDATSDWLLAPVGTAQRATLARIVAEQCLVASDGAGEAGRRSGLLRRAAALFVEAGDPARVRLLFDAWRDRHRADVAGLSPATALRLFLGDELPAPVMRAIFETVPPRRTRAMPAWGRWAAAAVAVLGVGALTLRATAGGEEATRLALAVVPLVAVPGQPPVPAPVVEVLDDAGRRIADATDSVTVTSLTPGVVLQGDSSAPLVGGTATFKRSALSGALGGEATLRFRYRDLPPLDVRVQAPGAERSSLLLGRTTLNGVRLLPPRREITVAPGEPIRGDVELIYTSLWATQTVLLGITPTWGEPSTAFAPLGPVSTPAVETSTHWSIDLRAPSTPGRYAIIFAMQAAPSVAHLLSGTAADAPAPRWGDGNDVAEWTPAMWREASTEGRVRARVALPPGPDGAVRYAMRFVPATVVTVVVR